MFMRRLKTTLIFLLTITILNQSCLKSKEDHSLTIEEYKKLGMPDPSKSWESEEYRSANMALSSLKIHYPDAFPRKNSKKSGELFNKFVDKNNLSFVNNKEIPLRARAFIIQNYPRFQYEMTSLYTNRDTSVRKQYYHEELIETCIFGLYIQGKMLDLAGMIMNSEKEEEKSIQSGLSKVVYNYLKTLKNIMDEQVKTDVYTKEDLERLSSEMLGSITHNIEWILPADRQTISAGMQKVIDQSSSDIVKDNYRKAIEITHGKIDHE